MLAVVVAGEIAAPFVVGLMAPGFEPRKVFVGFGQRERAADETHRAMIGEIARMVGAAVGIGNLAVAAEIDAAQDDAPARRLDEMFAGGGKARQAHDGGSKIALRD